MSASAPAWIRRFVQSSREPFFNIPLAVLAVVVLLVAVHALRLALPEQDDVKLIVDFGFIPGRLTAALGGDPLQDLAVSLADDPESLAASGRLALGHYALADGSRPWTLLSYAFLHGGWGHLAINSIWLLAFGAAVARRFASARFLGFLVVTAIGGAIGYWIARPNEIAPMIGASAAISGCMAGAIRFVFQPGAPLARIKAPDEFAYRLPALPLAEVLRDRTVLAFLAIWFSLNLVTGIGAEPFGLTDAAIAWQAHVGGFVTGLLAFPLFDPPLREAAPPPGARR